MPVSVRLGQIRFGSFFFLMEKCPTAKNPRALQCYWSPCLDDILSLLFCFLDYNFFLPDEVCRCTRNVVPFFYWKFKWYHKHVSVT